MSKKYVPSFLKNNDSAAGGGSNTNYRPLVNTSRPAIEAPKLAPATMASLTANKDTPILTSGSTLKYTRELHSNTTTPVQTAPLNLQSENDFPSLGGTGKKVLENTIVSPPKRFADLAKAWAKKQEDEEEDERIRLAEEARRKRENSMFSKGVMIMRFNRKRKDDSDDEEEVDYNPTYEDDAQEEDNYESSSHDEQEQNDETYECENEDDEFNENIGHDGRRGDDLY